MSFEISENDGHENVLSPTGQYQSFVDEFLDKVSIKTIMSGSRSIGRNEARLMLAQFREYNIEMVRYDDPGVLMLDGLPLSELEEFLESGGVSLEFAIRGDDDKEELLSIAENKESTTLSEL